jgi:hypothetical protein
LGCEWWIALYWKKPASLVCNTARSTGVKSCKLCIDWRDDDPQILEVWELSSPLYVSRSLENPRTWMLFLNLFGTTLCINFYIENFLNELFYFFSDMILPKIHQNVLLLDVCTQFILMCIPFCHFCGLSLGGWQWLFAGMVTDKSILGSCLVFVKCSMLQGHWDTYILL